MLDSGGLVLPPGAKIESLDKWESENRDYEMLVKKSTCMAPSVRQNLAYFKYKTQGDILHKLHNTIGNVYSPNVNHIQSHILKGIEQFDSTDPYKFETVSSSIWGPYFADDIGLTSSGMKI